MSTQGRSRAKRAAETPPGISAKGTLVIIPTYNELENLPLIVGRVHKARPDVHVLVVDDSSPDGTGELADELALADPDRIHVRHRRAKDGLGAAYLAGTQDDDLHGNNSSGRAPEGAKARSVARWRPRGFRERTASPRPGAPDPPVPRG